MTKLSKTIVVKCKTHAGNNWWQIDVPVLIEYQDRNDFVAKLKAGLSAFPSMGLIPQEHTTVATSQPTNGRPPAKLETNGNSHPLPCCELHGGTMARSKHQNRQGYTLYYCPQRDMNGNYCIHRASVDNSTGMPQFRKVASA